MASKGGITITQDELMRMKMRANLVPTCIYAFTQPTQNRTERHTCSRRVRRGRASGPTTSRTSRNARKRRGTKNSRRRSWSADASTRRSATKWKISQQNITRAGSKKHSARSIRTVLRAWPLTSWWISSRMIMSKSRGNNCWSCLSLWIGREMARWNMFSS
jgi:hypothetical protein